MPASSEIAIRNPVASIFALEKTSLRWSGSVPIGASSATVSRA
jgi:hypothetical protein